jgi:U3 small nucleolar RNA-associated protein 14
VNEVKERQQRLAKMRSALFYHEAKAKRMKRIKSKAFHRLLHKGQKSQAGGSNELDPEAMREEAVKAEFKRAQVR